MDDWLADHSDWEITRNWVCIVVPSWRRQNWTKRRRICHSSVVLSCQSEYHPVWHNIVETEANSPSLAHCIQISGDTQCGLVAGVDQCRGCWLGGNRASDVGWPHQIGLRVKKCCVRCVGQRHRCLSDWYWRGLGVGFVDWGYMRFADI